MISDQSLEWYIVDEDLAEGSADLVFSTANTAEFNPEQPNPQWASSWQNRIYELVLALGILYGFAAFFIWQTVDRHMNTLEEELLLLNADIAKLQAEASQETLIPQGDTPSSHRTLETGLLRFEFNAADESIVRAIADLCNEKYAQLMQDLDLALPTAEQKLTISVVEPPLLYSQYGENIVTVSSPKRPTLQYSMSQADLLTDEIYSSMARRLWWRAIRARRMSPQWQALTGAIRYFFWAENQYGEPRALTDAQLARRHAAQTQPLTLAYSVIRHDEQNVMQELITHVPTAEHVSDPLAEYLMETYSHVTIPLLLDAFEQHSSWDTLAPALFDVSASELEAHWHSYLAEKYPIPE